MGELNDIAEGIAKIMYTPLLKIYYFIGYIFCVLICVLMINNLK